MDWFATPNTYDVNINKITKFFTDLLKSLTM